MLYAVWFEAVRIVAWAEPVLGPAVLVLGVVGLPASIVYCYMAVKRKHEVIG